MGVGVEVGLEVWVWVEVEEEVEVWVEVGVAMGGGGCGGGGVGRDRNGAGGGGEGGYEFMKIHGQLELQFVVVVGEFSVGPVIKMCTCVRYIATRKHNGTAVIKVCLCVLAKANKMADSCVSNFL